MAVIIPFKGKPRSIAFTKDEALTVLATLNAHPTYANQRIREVLVQYIERMP